MKKSNKGGSRPKLRPKSLELSRLAENPPIIIKSGGGALGSSPVLQSDVPTITVPKEFVMVELKPGVWNGHEVTLWRRSFTPSWSLLDFQVNIQGDLVTFPMTHDNVVLVTLNNGWVKFKAVPPNDENASTSLWIEASDYLLGVTTPSATDPYAWMVSQFIPLTVIIRAEVYPQDSISSYSCTNGDMKMMFNEAPLWPRPH